MELDNKTIKKYYDVVKIANAIAFFVENDVKHLGITKLMKLFFFSDKYHLEKVGKSIFNHTYTKMERGPVPTLVYGIIRTSISGDNDYDFDEEVKVFNHFIEANTVETSYGNKVIFNAKLAFNNKFFSQSQLDTMLKVVDDFKDMQATGISDVSHETHAWKSVNMNQLISKTSMIDDTEMKKYVAFSERQKNNFSENYNLHKLLAV